MNFCSLPLELLEQVLIYLHYCDLKCMERVCRSTRDLILATPSARIRKTQLKYPFPWTALDHNPASKGRSEGIYYELDANIFHPFLMAGGAIDDELPFKCPFGLDKKIHIGLGVHLGIDNGKTLVFSAVGCLQSQEKDATSDATEKSNEGESEIPEGAFDIIRKEYATYPPVAKLGIYTKIFQDGYEKCTDSVNTHRSTYGTVVNLQGVTVGDVLERMNTGRQTSLFASTAANGIQRLLRKPLGLRMHVFEMYAKDYGDVAADGTEDEDLWVCGSLDRVRREIKGKIWKFE